MKMAKIENGTVVDVAIAKEPPKKGSWVELQSSFGIGDLYENGVFSKPIKSLSELKNSKLDQLKTYFDQISARPVIDTGYGFSVQAGYSDLIDFQTGLDLGILTIRAADNSNHTVTEEQFTDIINQIKQNGVRLKSTKWELESEIEAAESIEQLDAINFEQRFEASELTPAQILARERAKLIKQLEVDLQENAIDTASAIAEDGANEDNNVGALRTERVEIKTDFQTNMIQLMTGVN